MRIFLTGGTGFLGGEIARLLRERGDVVRGLVRAPAAAGATGKKAAAELGWSSRPLDEGLRQLASARQEART
jgi:uncharacterized protein YbjT (DUF2867 family)